MSLFQRLFGTRTPQEVEARLLPVIKMMLIDGKADAKETPALFIHLERLGLSREQGKRMVGEAVGREIPLPTDPRHRVEVLSMAAMMMTVDGEVAVEELAYLHFLAGRMEIPPGVLAQVIEQAIGFGKAMNPDVDVRRDYEAALGALALLLTR